MAYDLSTYEGRQQARDAGNWVGADSSGNIVMESSGGGTTSTISGGGGTPTTTSGGGTTTFQTTNGAKTQQQMYDELHAVGYNGPTDDASIRDAYARTTGGTVSGGTTAPSTGASPPANKVPTTNLDAFNTAVSQASAQAYQAYLNSKLQLDNDTLAFQKAQQAFSETISKANLTGMFEGAQTLAGQKQAADIAAQQAGLTGIYRAPGAPTPTGNTAVDAFNTLATPAQKAQYTAQAGGNAMTAAGQWWNDYQPTLQAQGTTWEQLQAQLNQGTPTLAAQGQYFNQALAQQTLNQKTTQDYLGLIAGLRGPQDYGQYLKTLASTPQGLQSLVSNAAGTAGRVPGFGTTGVPQNPATLGGMMGAGATGGTATGTTYADYQAAAQGLPSPSQIAPQAWNAMTDSQKQLLLGMYESTGWNVTDAQQQYAASLPRYGSSGPQAGAVKLV